MKIFYIILSLITVFIFVVIFIWPKKINNNYMSDQRIFLESEEEIVLPKAKITGEISLETAILNRRSIRKYQEAGLSLLQISQILWSAQGITDQEKNLRSAPSAGALYPLDVYIVILKSNEEIESGLYKYNVKTHSLLKVDNFINIEEDLRNSIGEQFFIMESSAILFIVANYEKTTSKYGEKGVSYVHIESGAVAQNIYLQATSLKLGTVMIGAFNNLLINNILNLHKNEEPLLLMPIGFLL
jgi:SagB-type dehydrogenase family enzyme